jgi:hypothetical protein
MSLGVRLTGLALASRAPGGITLGREQGELAADFTALGELKLKHFIRAARCTRQRNPYASPGQVFMRDSATVKVLMIKPDNRNLPAT